MGKLLLSSVVRRAQVEASAHQCARQSTCFTSLWVAPRWLPQRQGGDWPGETAALLTSLYVMRKIFMSYSVTVLCTINPLNPKCDFDGRVYDFLHEKRENNRPPFFWLPTTKILTLIKMGAYFLVL